MRLVRFLLTLSIVCLSASGFCQCTRHEALESVPVRPTVTNSASTTDCGVIEADYGATLLAWPDSHQQVLTGSVRVGITDKLDVRWAADSFNRLNPSDGVASSGVGDQNVTVRYRFMEASAKKPALAFSYTIKVPSASPEKNLGTGLADQQWTLLASKDLRKAHLDVNLGAESLGVQGSSHDYAGTWSAALSYAFTSRFSPVAEMYSTTSLNGPNSNLVSTLWGASYKVSPRVYLDCAADLGLTSGAAKHRFIMGVTYAVGNLFNHPLAAMKH